MADFEYSINGGPWVLVTGVELPYEIAAAPTDTVLVRAAGRDAGRFAPPLVVAQQENARNLTGVFSLDAANLVDQSHIIHSGTSPDGAGMLLGDGSNGLPQFDFSTPASNVWVSCITTKNDEFAGTSYRARLLSPNLDGGQSTNRNRSGNQVFKIAGQVSSTKIGLVSSADYGRLEYLQAVNMDAVLAMPCDVYIAAGQSNMATTTNGLGLDLSLDAWTDPRLLYAAGATNQNYGVSLGSIEALRAPLQAAAESGGAVISTGFSSGVSPAVAFGKTILHSTPEDRAVCVIMAAVGGTTLIGADQQWAPGGVAHSHAEAVIAAAMANLPAGSEIKGALWAQGESDVNVADLSPYPEAWAAMRADFEATWQTSGWAAGQVPWVIGTTPPDSTLVGSSTGNTAADLTEMQRELATGGNTGQPRVAVVERIAGVEADGFHATAQSNRDLGYRMAAAMWGL